MTQRRPPNQPPPLDAYRPRQDMPGRGPGGGQPAGVPQGQNLGPQRLPPRPLPPGAPRRGGARVPEPPRGRGFRWGRVIGFGLLALVLAAGSGAAYLVLNPPSDLIRDQLVQQVKRHTGRDLKIAGNAKFTIYPSLSVEMAGVELSAPPGMSGRPLLTAESVKARLKLLPLLTRSVEVERVTLVKPFVELRIDKSGRKSWEFAAADGAGQGGVPGQPAARVRLAQASPAGRATDAAAAGAAPARAQAASPLAAIEGLAIEKVRIENGSLAYEDERAGPRHVVDVIFVDIEAPSLQSALEVKGHLNWLSDRFDVDVSATPFRALLDRTPAALSIQANNRHATLAYDGKLTLADAVDAKGKADVRIPDLRALMSFLGVKIGPGPGLKQAAIAGKLDASGKGYTLNDATISLDGATATGIIGVSTAGQKPLVMGNLKVGALDLNKYIGDGAPAAGGAAPAPQPAAAPAAPAPQPAAKPAAGAGPAAGPQTIDDLLKRGGPQVKGYTKRGSWSEQPIATAALGAVDADLKLQIGKLSYEEIKIGQTLVNVALKGGALRTTFDEVQLYQGRARGVVTLDGTAAVPTLGANITADAVQALPLLKDAADIDWLAGTGKLSLTLAGQGSTQKAIMESLSGNADLVFNNGAIVGWNIPQIIRGLRQGQVSGFDRVSTSKTDFSELASTWTIAGGVAQNQDLRMVTPLLRVTGAGRVLIGARQLDYVLRPKVVASLDGQGGAQNLAGLEVPVKIKGTWEAPEIAPDFNAILKDPNQALGALKEIGKQFKGKQPNEIVDQVLRDNPNAAKKANDLLDKFLKPKAQ